MHVAFTDDVQEGRGRWRFCWKTFLLAFFRSGSFTEILSFFFGQNHGIISCRKNLDRLAIDRAKRLQTFKTKLTKAPWVVDWHLSGELDCPAPFLLLQLQCNSLCIKKYEYSATVVLYKRSLLEQNHLTFFFTCEITTTTVIFSWSSL